MTIDVVRRIDTILNGRTMLSEREQLLDAARDEIKRLRRLNHYLLHHAAQIMDDGQSSDGQKESARLMLEKSDDGK